MKTLYIARHAKSSWDLNGISDRERPLLEKGRVKTRLVIDFLKSKNVKPDLIVCSSAIRAHQTSILFADGLDYPINSIRVEDFIYHADAEKLTDLFYEISSLVESVMIVGHNPTVTNLSNIFLKNNIEWMPTSAIACLQFDVERWEEVSPMNCKDIFYITPKMLKKL